MPTEGTLVLQLAHEVADAAEVRLRLRPVSRTLRDTLAPHGTVRTWHVLHRTRRVWRTWVARAAQRRARVRARMLRPVVVSWYRTRVRDDDTPIFVFVP